MTSSKRHRRASAAVGVTAWAGIVCAGAASCGGDNRGARPAPDASVTVYPVPDDPGSGPVDCSLTDPYEMSTLENFEFGAATGWYTNNEVCYPWTQAQTECTDAGVVCLPGSQVSNNPSCHAYVDDAGVMHTQMPQVYNLCYGQGQVDCSDPHALDRCAAECIAVQPNPPFAADQLPGSLIQNAGRCGSLYALDVQAGPFVNWGGNVGKRFASPFDMSAWDGIAMWMRTGAGYTNDPRISLSDMFTDSQYNMYPPAGMTAYCNPNPSCAAQAAQGNSNCYNVGCDTFGTSVNVTEDWRLYLFPFTEMRQGGWGKMQPSLDLTQIYSIQISYPVGTWDLWVDDIALYRLKSP